MNLKKTTTISVAILATLMFGGCTHEPTLVQDSVETIDKTGTREYTIYVDQEADIKRMHNRALSSIDSGLAADVKDKTSLAARLPKATQDDRFSMVVKDRVVNKGAL